MRKKAKAKRPADPLENKPSGVAPSTSSPGCTRTSADSGLGGAASLSVAVTATAAAVEEKERAALREVALLRLWVKVKNAAQRSGIRLDVTEVKMRFDSDVQGTIEVAYRDGTTEAVEIDLTRWNLNDRDEFAGG